MAFHIIHVFSLQTNHKKQTKENCVVHIAYIQTHLEVQDIDSCVNYCKQCSIQTTRKLTSVCLEYGTMNRDCGVLIQ